MAKVKVMRKVKGLHLTADEWDLYTVSHPREAERAAQAINAAIEEAVNGGCSREETRLRAQEVMRKDEDLGAFDTEPLDKLEDVLDRIYGREG